MNLTTTFRDTFMFLETFERGLNIAGYVPLLGSISGRIRSLYAKLEIITGLVLAIFAVGIQLKGNPHHLICLTFGATLIGHGILNHIRSSFEFVPGVALVTTLPYDLIAGCYTGNRFFSYI